ncbi:MAG: nickel-dependent lactate racemase [Thermoleophilia bacterium]|nr:nickel-dependent lactate racemase [Thermoleophilia bacterium]
MGREDLNRLADIDDVLQSLLEGGPLEGGPLHGADALLRCVSDPPAVDAAAALRAALEAPTGTPPLRALAAGQSSAAVVTSDATRAVPNGLLLPVVLDELAAGGIAADAVTVIVGGGAHRPATVAELRGLFGEDLLHRVRVVTHDARCSACLEVGVTPAGTPVRINQILAEADLRIAFGVVEPHEFAGFTGGRKALLPGVAAYETIVHNHAPDAVAHERAHPGGLSGNPIHEDMIAALRVARLDFIVNATLDRRLRPTAVAAGDPEAAHDELVAFVRRTATVEVPGAPDLIVTGPGAPLDLNLYQALKALIAVQPLVGPETVVVLAAGCADGLGSDDMLEPFDGAAGPDDAHARAVATYTIEKDHSCLLARFLARCPNVVACCPGVADADLRRLWFTPAATLEAAVEEAVRRARRLSRRARPTALLLPRPQRALFTVVPSSPTVAAGPGDGSAGPTGPGPTSTRDPADTRTPGGCP